MFKSNPIRSLMYCFTIITASAVFSPELSLAGGNEGSNPQIEIQAEASRSIFQVLVGKEFISRKDFDARNDLALPELALARFNFNIPLWIQEQMDWYKLEDSDFMPKFVTGKKYSISQVVDFSWGSRIQISSRDTYQEKGSAPLSLINDNIECWLSIPAFSTVEDLLAYLAPVFEFEQ